MMATAQRGSRHSANSNARLKPSNTASELEIAHGLRKLRRKTARHSKVLVPYRSACMGVDTRLWMLQAQIASIKNTSQFTGEERLKPSVWARRYWAHPARLRTAAAALAKPENESKLCRETIHRTDPTLFPLRGRLQGALEARLLQACAGYGVPQYKDTSGKSACSFWTARQNGLAESSGCSKAAARRARRSSG